MLELRWKLSPCCLISTVPEDARQAAGGEKLPMILAAVRSPCYKSSFPWLKGGRSVIYQTPILTKGSHPWYYWTWSHALVRKAIKPTSVLPNGHVIKLPGKYLGVCWKTGSPLSISQRSFSCLQFVAVNARDSQLPKVLRIIDFDFSAKYQPVQGSWDMLTRYWKSKI